MACIDPWISPQGLVPCPCRKCMDCRIDQQAKVVHRVLMECDTHVGAVGFLTLTYDQQHEPAGGSLDRRDNTLFLKRLREVTAREWPGRRIRFLRVGEYGKGGRPHYHMVLFGLTCEHGHRTRTSSGGWQCECRPCQLVRQTWTSGFSSLEQFGEDAAKYIAKYCLKRMSDREDPRLNGREPEFMTRSNRPGLGRLRIDEIAKEVLAAWSLDEKRRYHDVPHALKRGRRRMPLDQYSVRKLREACGREPSSPPEVRAAALAKDAEAYAGALFVGSSGRRHFNATTLKAELIWRNKQGALNKKAREDFGSRTRWGVK